MARSAGIVALSTAVPPHGADQLELAEWLCRHFDYRERAARFVRHIHARSGIAQRYSVVPDFGCDAEPVLFGPGLRCDITSRMQVFGRTAPLLAEVACRRALEQARIEPDRISHLVLVTSTGFMTPGPDIVLAKRLGLRPDVERTVVAMHGCAGGTTGLSAAQRIARSDPDAMVLLVAVEICSIHLRDGTRRDAMVANSLFADGAAAAVLRAVEPGEECLAALGSRHTEVVPDSHRVMEWTLHPTGFDLRLSRDLPDLVHDSLKRLGEAGLAGSRRHDGGRAPITSWVVHPGGPGVLRAVLESLSLDHSALASSARVLREHGNLSSATVLFVLRAELDARSFDAGKQRGVIMSFGPGMCLDTIEFSPGGAPI